MKRAFSTQTGIRNPVRNWSPYKVSPKDEINIENENLRIVEMDASSDLIRVPTLCTLGVVTGLTVGRLVVYTLTPVGSSRSPTPCTSTYVLRTPGSL